MYTTQAQDLTPRHGYPQDGSVDGSELLFDILRVLRRYVLLPKPHDRCIPLWILHTWVYDTGHFSPILAVASPERRCGKTTLLELLGLLVQNPVWSTSATPAVMFRIIEQENPTLLIDEADTARVGEQDVRNLLNSGYAKTGIVRRAVSGGGTGYRTYSTFYPKVLGLIGGLPPTVHDRSIIIPMARWGPSDPEVEVFDRAQAQVALEEIKARCSAWAEEARERLVGTLPNCPEELDSRARDSFRPLFRIADLCGPWSSYARKAAVEISESSSDEDFNISIMLLHDIREVFRFTRRKGFTGPELATALAQLEDRPWFDWHGPKGFTAHQLAKLLRPFGVRPQVRYSSLEGRPLRGYREGDFDDVFSRYLKPLPLMEEHLPDSPLQEEKRARLGRLRRSGGRGRGGRYR